MAACIANLCRELIQEWEDLWFDLDAEDAPIRTQNLNRWITRITAPALHEGGFLDDELNKRCDKETNDYWTAALTT